MAEKDILEKVLLSQAEALCEMMEALTGDARFTALTTELLKRQEKGCLCFTDREAGW